jgi:hypothetical protein
MPEPVPTACERPTLYFIGVSTRNSSIMRVFPRWADILGIDADIRATTPGRGPSGACIAASCSTCATTRSRAGRW